MDSFAWKNELVAVKTHFGERGSSAFPPPIYVRRLADIMCLLKKKGH